MSKGWVEEEVFEKRGGDNEWKKTGRRGRPFLLYSTLLHSIIPVLCYAILFSPISSSIKFYPIPFYSLSFSSLPFTPVLSSFLLSHSSVLSHSLLSSSGLSPPIFFCSVLVYLCESALEVSYEGVAEIIPLRRYGEVRLEGEVLGEGGRRGRRKEGLGEGRRRRRRREEE